jgi:hypothetical protein
LPQAVLKNIEIPMFNERFMKSSKNWYFLSGGSDEAICQERLNQVN